MPQHLFNTIQFQIIALDLISLNCFRIICIAREIRQFSENQTTSFDSGNLKFSLRLAKMKISGFEIFKSSSTSSMHVACNSNYILIRACRGKLRPLIEYLEEFGHTTNAIFIPKVNRNSRHIPEPQCRDVSWSTVVATTSLEYEQPSVTQLLKIWFQISYREISFIIIL